MIFLLLFFQRAWASSIFLQKETPFLTPPFFGFSECKAPDHHRTRFLQSVGVISHDFTLTFFREG